MTETEMTQDPSRWWYALVPFPILVGLRYGLLWLTTLLLPTSGPSRSEALPVLLSGLSASIVGALVVATAPLFVAGVVLDLRTVRDRTSWRPHWGFGILGVVPIIGIFVEWVALFSIPAAIGYLELRRRNIGHPFGHGVEDMDRMRDTVERSSLGSPSRWWYGVVIPPVLELSGGGVFWMTRTAGLLGQGSDPLSLLVPIALIVAALGFVPLFAISLFLDAKRVREASGNEIPVPQVWGLLGIGSLIGLLLLRITFMPLIALAYVVRRRQADAPLTFG